MNDGQLLKRYLEAEDHEAFTQLVERHAGMIYGVSLRRSADREIAEEVVQTVFVQLAKKASSLKDPSRLVGWLHRSALLESAHLLRKRRREATRQARLALEMEASEEGWSSLAPVIDEALNELSPSDRELILAKYYEGFTYREIAERQAKKRHQGSGEL